MTRNFLSEIFDFKNQCAVITGGAGVLGSQFARILLECNSNVAILDIHSENAQKTVDPENQYSDQLICILADVLDKDSLEAATNKIIEKYGKVDFLINAAGGNHPNATTNPILSFFELPTEAIRFTSDLNLLGTIIPCQVIGKIMAEQGEGIILNISSMNALQPLTRIPAYSAAKAAVSNFTQWLAVHMSQEYSPKIRVNAIAPGFLLTQQNQYLLLDEKTGKITPRGKKIIEHTPMGRYGDPKDLIGITLLLLSSASSFVTGIVVPIDGGFSAYSGV